MRNQMFVMRFILTGGRQRAEAGQCVWPVASVAQQRGAGHSMHPAFSPVLSASAPGAHRAEPWCHFLRMETLCQQLPFVLLWPCAGHSFKVHSKPSQ